MQNSPTEETVAIIGRVSYTIHRANAPLAVRCLVLTVSDTRNDNNDHSGNAIVDLLSENGHDVVDKTIVSDDMEHIGAALDSMLKLPTIDVIITTGGTGISHRDGTYEVVVKLFEKQIDGFGELFRSLSFSEIGSAAMLSRACAGLVNGKIVISLPGSEHAVRLAMTKLVLPELGHLVHEAKR